MWLRRFILYLRHRYLLYRYEVSGVQALDRVYTRALLRLLHPVDFTHYHATLGKGHRLTLLYPTIGLMTQRLDQMVTCMRADEAIPVEWLRATPETVTLDAWLSVHDGFYVRPEEALDAFLVQADRLCDLLILHQDATVGTQAYNWRVMRTLFLNLQALAELLVPVALRALAE